MRSPTSYDHMPQIRRRKYFAGDDSDSLTRKEAVPSIQQRGNATGLLLAPRCRACHVGLGVLPQHRQRQLLVVRHPCERRARSRISTFKIAGGMALLYPGCHTKRAFMFIAGRALFLWMAEERGGAWRAGGGRSGRISCSITSHERKKRSARRSFQRFMCNVESRRCSLWQPDHIPLYFGFSG